LVKVGIGIGELGKVAFIALPHIFVSPMDRYKKVPSSTLRWDRREISLVPR